MTNLQEQSPPVNMAPIADLAPRLRRDLAFARAAQLMADTCRLSQNLPRLQLAVLDPLERDFYKDSSRALIEVFEAMTTAKEPDAVERQRDVQAKAETSRLELALETRLRIERSRARVAAIERGHELGFWNTLGGEGQQAAYCVRCGRAATINVGDEPVIAGAALTEGCLVAAEGSER